MQAEYGINQLSWTRKARRFASGWAFSSSRWSARRAQPKTDVTLADGEAGRRDSTVQDKGPVVLLSARVIR